MIIQSCEIKPYQLPLKQAWLSHQGRFEQRCGWLITMSADGYVGVGDCAPLASAGTETEEQAMEWLQQHVDHFKGEEVETLLASLDNLSPPPAARCGIETALIDLLARQKQLSIAHWLNASASKKVKVNANLGTLDETVTQRLADAKDYSAIKLKVGLASIEQELIWLQQLSRELAEGVSLRLDANRAWNIDQAGEFISAISNYPIESIEEPLASPDLEQLQQLQSSTMIPLALDESLTEIDLEELWQKPAVKRITLKPMVQGGLLPCMALAQRAYKAGMDVVVTTTVDSAVGVWAATSLAAALGKKGEELTHGLATSCWLSHDVAEPPAIQRGIINLEQQQNIKLL